MDKRLYRSSHDRVFLGVCGGMGEYFNIDPVLIRVIAVIITVVTGFFPGIIAYLVIALVIPLEGSTISNPRDSIRENMDDLRDSTNKMGQDFRSSWENKPPGTGTTPRTATSQSGIVVLGLVIIALGIIFLLGNIFGWFWPFVWPVFLIVGGIVVILLVVRRR
jgi:phage shock protein C